MEDKNLTMARLIAEKVRERGGRVYYVGGFVRDIIMGKESKDIDIEVHGITPEALMEILSGVGTPNVMGASFGILGLSHYDIDISMPKKDGADRGKNDFSASADPFAGTEKAALRRDFTMNALMQDVLTGEIVDCFGGVSDIKNRIIRHIDDKTFTEDPLRVIRAAQFSARFGFKIAEETAELCRSIDITKIPFERIFEELKKALMKSDKPSVFFDVLRNMNALDFWFPEVKALIGVEQPPQFHPEGDVWVHTMMVLDKAATLRDKAQFPTEFMLSALCHDFGKVCTTKVIDGRIRSFGHEEEGIPIAEGYIKRLTRDVKLRKYVANMVKLHMRPNIIASQKSSLKAFCKLFDESVCPEDLLLLSESDFLGRTDSEDYTERKEYLAVMLSDFKERMNLPYVGGDDLIKLGYKPSKELGEALRYAHKLRLSGVPKKDALRQTVTFIESLNK